MVPGGGYGGPGRGVQAGAVLAGVGKLGALAAAGGVDTGGHGQGQRKM